MLAAIAAAVAVLAAWTCADHRVLRRLASRPAEPAAGARRLGAGAVIAALSGATVLGGGLIDGRRGATLAATGAIVAATGRVLWRRSRDRRCAAGERLHVVEAGEALGGLLGVGAIPAVALSMLATEHPVFAQAAAEVEIGGDPVAGLRRAAKQPGRAGLADLAAAWEVAASTGASLRVSVDAIADDLRRRQEVEGTVRVELAASRSAGRLLGVLPLAGLGLGYGFGGDPLAFLTVNPLGQASLVTAAGLAAIGLIWTDVLADRGVR